MLRVENSIIFQLSAWISMNLVDELREIKNRLPESNLSNKKKKRPANRMSVNMREYNGVEISQLLPWT